MKACCADACMQGRGKCATPDACRLPESGVTAQVFWPVAILVCLLFWVGVWKAFHD